MTSSLGFVLEKGMAEDVEMREKKGEREGEGDDSEDMDDGVREKKVKGNDQTKGSSDSDSDSDSDGREEEDEEDSSSEEEEEEVESSATKHTLLRFRNYKPRHPELKPYVMKESQPQADISDVLSQRLAQLSEVKGEVNERKLKSKKKSGKERENLESVGDAKKIYLNELVGTHPSFPFRISFIWRRRKPIGI